MLASQRFRPNGTLERCVTEGHRMLAGEPDSDAVARMQSALRDLGYQIAGGSDGQFGDSTGEAVVAFKTDEGLEPNDPVASTGTIGRLDEYFAHEPEDPDSPDPSSVGLVDLARQSMAVAKSWIDVAITDLEGYVAPVGEDLDPLALDAEASFHLSSLNAGPAAGVSDFVLPTFRRASRLLDPANTVIVLAEFDRAGAAAATGAVDYLVGAPMVGGCWNVLPPFRNALSPEEQAVGVLRLAVRDEGLVDLFAVPNSPRSLGLSGNEGVRNQMAYGSFAFRRATGTDTVWRPRYRWHLI